MQRPDEKKRREIMNAAAKLFAKKPFHSVRLDEIAALASIGKGTLYVYFDSKEDLYGSLIHDGLCQLVHDLRGELAELDRVDAPSWKRLEMIVRRLVGFAFRFPDLFVLMRQGLQPADAKLQEKRRELADLVESVVRRGVRRAEFVDAHPELTAQYVLSFVRAALLYRPEGVNEKRLTAHALHVLGRGLLRDGAPDPRDLVAPRTPARKGAKHS